MKAFHVSWNDPETVFHEMPWKKNFTVYPSLKNTSGGLLQHSKDVSKIDNKLWSRIFPAVIYLFKAEHENNV